MTHVLKGMADRWKQARPHLQKAEIYQSNWKDTFDKYSQDNENFIFLDPPYVEGCVFYAGGNFSLLNREELVNSISEAKCNLTYTDYEHEPIEGFSKHLLRTRRALTGVASYATRKVKKPAEVIYSNYSRQSVLF